MYLWLDSRQHMLITYKPELIFIHARTIALLVSITVFASSQARPAYFAPTDRPILFVNVTMAGLKQTDSPTGLPTMHCCN